MNNLAKLAIGLAAVMVVAIVGLNLLPRTWGSAASDRRSSPVARADWIYPRPSGSPTSRRVTCRPGELAAGTYEAVSRASTRCRSRSPSRTAGTARAWSSSRPAHLGRPPRHVRELPAGRTTSTPTLALGARPTRPSDRRWTTCAEAAAAIPETESSPTVDVTLDGRAAKLVEFVIPETYACDLGKFVVQASTTRRPPYGETRSDVDRRRRWQPVRHHGRLSTRRVSEADKAELQGVVDSVTFP